MVVQILLLLSGLVASASLFSHRRLITFLAATAGLWELQWLLLTLLSRTIFTSTSSQAVYIIGSLLLLAGTMLLVKQQRPHVPLGRSRHDLLGDVVAVGITLVVLIGAYAVLRVNGFTNNAWITHGFYNGDTATFTALVERSLHTATLVRENPFAGNGPLEYPTLLHAGVAQLFSESGGGSWLYYLPLMTYATILFTIPLFFLYSDAVAILPKQNLKSAAIILLMLTVSWDSYIYPQSHFFLIGLFLLELALLAQAYQAKNAMQYVYAGISGAAALVLLLSNAVTGTAAVAALGVYFLWRRQVLVCIAIAMLFFLLAPGNASFGGIHFSYTAVANLLQLAPLMALLTAGSFAALQQEKLHLVSLPALLAIFAFATFIFSSRHIVAENASRFLYHALLAGFPLIGLVKIKPAPTKFMGWVLAAIAASFVLLPSAASVASAYDNLLRKDKQVIDTAMRTALWWIEDNTAPNAIVLASPDEPFAVPAFTGRALLRSNYWLSPDDVVQADVNAAFSGDLAAREHVFLQADYLLLTKSQRPQFEPLPTTYQKVFDNNAVVIYHLSHAKRS